MKRPRETVGGHFPALGDAGDGLGGFLVERREPFEKRDGEVLVGAGADELRIEVLGFGAVAEVEDAVSVARRNARLAWTAADEKNSGAEK